jgi:hypothetical protein
MPTADRAGGHEWLAKGATLSDKSARAEFGLTQEEIYAAVREGKLQYREASVHGSPWLRLLRREVQALVASKHGEAHLERQTKSTELRRVERELKQLRRQVAELEG